MLDWLKTILGDAYTEEIDGKVAAELGKGYAPRADLDAAMSAKQSLEATVQDRDKQLDGLKKAGNSDELKQQIAQLQEANKAAKAEFDSSLKKITMDGKIESALLGAGARNTKAVRALMDDSKFSLDGENVLGLQEQLDAVKKSAAYLFGDEKPANPPAPGGGEPPKPSADADMAKWAAEAGVKLPKA